MLMGRQVRDMATQSEIELMMEDADHHLAGPITRCDDGTLRTYYAGFNLTALAAYIARELAQEGDMNEKQIKHMVDRFLNWRLPKPWNPDNGVSYKRPNYAHPPADHDWPTGTNLFGADEATAMVRHMIDGMPPPNDK